MRWLMLCGDNLTLLDHRPADWAWMVKAGSFRFLLHARPNSHWPRGGNHLLPPPAAEQPEPADPA